jgi:ferredoxin
MIPKPVGLGAASLGAAALVSPGDRARPTPWSVAIDDRCTACGACLSTCPEHALLPAARRPVVVAERCSGCGECVEICPRGAITDVWDR